MRAIVLPAVLAVGLAGCSSEPPPDSVSTEPATAPYLFDNLGDLARPGASAVPEAQRYFDQGLRLTYGFNHQAAGFAFAEAARLDPDCVLCLWGQALVLGPNINLPMLPEAAAPAHALAQQALRLKDKARSSADRALIEALSSRYADPAPDDRAPLDRAYAAAMADLVRRFPDDDDVATLYAEALMDLSPWAYWQPDGSPGEHTAELIAELEKVIERNPDHLGAIHYYIHAVEASDRPERAQAGADRLAELAPGAGHLVHMPAHIYLRVGRYHDATLHNLAASGADEFFLGVCRGSNGVYPLGYVPHNWHFAAMSASLEGASAMALNAAGQTAERADRGQLQALPFMQHFLVTPLFVQLRFGRWDAVLGTAAAPAELPFPRAIWHFARGLAQLRQGQPDAAARELDELERLAADPDLATTLVGTNNADRVLAVAVPFLRGELALARGEIAAGLELLRTATAAEDALAYYEPPDWPLPVRPYLGQALLQAGQAAEAEAVFQDDLARFPDNGWSLTGLAQAQRAQGEAGQAVDTEARLAQAWQWADVTLDAARL